MRTKKKLAEEITRLRKEMMVIRGQLDVLQATQIRSAWERSAPARCGWTWPTRVDDTGFRTPIMGMVMAPACYRADEDEGYPDDDDIEM